MDSSVIYYDFYHVENRNVCENIGENSEKAAQFFGKLENFLNGKICTVPLASTLNICISTELLPLFIFCLASVQWALQLAELTLESFRVGNSRASGTHTLDSYIFNKT